MTYKYCIHYKACDNSYNFVDEKDIDKIWRAEVSKFI